MSEKLNGVTGHEIAGLIMDLMSNIRNGVISIQEFKKFLTMKTSERRRVFGDNVFEFVSRFFQKTNVIKITKNPEVFIVGRNSVMDFLEPVIEREKELKNSEPYIDNCLWNYFNNKMIPGFIEDMSSTIYRFLVNLTHKQILDEAKNTGIKKVYTYLEGLSIIRQAILNGEVDKKENNIIVYFKVEGIATLYRFLAFRHYDNQLRVSMAKFNPVFECCAGHCVCFCN